MDNLVSINWSIEIILGFSFGAPHVNILWQEDATTLMKNPTSFHFVIENPL